MAIFFRNFRQDVLRRKDLCEYVLINVGWECLFIANITQITQDHDLKGGRRSKSLLDVLVNFARIWLTELKIYTIKIDSRLQLGPFAS